MTEVQEFRRYLASQRKGFALSDAALERALAAAKFGEWSWSQQGKGKRKSIRKDGTCKPGERADLTHCTPASHNGQSKPSANGDAALERARNEYRQENKPKDKLPKGVTSQKVKDGLIKLANMSMSEIGHNAVELGISAIDVEHALAEYATHKIEHNVAKLPKALQPIVKGTWLAVRFGWHKAFLTYEAGQKAAVAVAKQRGLSSEQAETLGKILSAVDVAAFKPVALGLHMTGLGAAALPASFVPIGSMTYLAYSTARDPVATYRAAREAIKSILPKRKKGMDHEDGLNALADALKKHSDHEKYLALYLAALDETQDADQAVQAANAAYDQFTVEK